jgi:hypothetical protein
MNQTDTSVRRVLQPGTYALDETTTMENRILMVNNNNARVNASATKPAIPPPPEDESSPSLQVFGNWALTHTAIDCSARNENGTLPLAANEVHVFG